MPSFYKSYTIDNFEDVILEQKWPAFSNDNQKVYHNCGIESMSSHNHQKLWWNVPMSTTFFY